MGSESISQHNRYPSVKNVLIGIKNKAVCESRCITVESLSLPFSEKVESHTQHYHVAKYTGVNQSWKADNDACSALICAYTRSYEDWGPNFANGFLNVLC